MSIITWRISCTETTGPNTSSCTQGLGPTFEDALADLIGEPIRPYEKLFVGNLHRAHAAVGFGGPARPDAS